MTIFNVSWDAFWLSVMEMSWLEIGMLVCFGASWPFSIRKMIKTGRTEGKSVLFLVLVMLGYIFGVLHKLFYQLDVVILLYLFLFLVVMTDLLICRRLRRKEQ